MKKNIARILVLVMLMTTLVACGKNNEGNDVPKDSEATTTQTDNKDTTVKKDTTEDVAEEVPTLSGNIVVATNMTNLVDSTLAQLAQDFMDANPGTTVEFEAIKDYESVISTRVAGGEAPDIFQVIEGMNQETYADYYQPLDDLDINFDNFLFARNNVGTDGSIYALSDSVNYTGVVYNKAAFAKAGITGVPTTMEEFWDVCAKLEGAGITPMGTAFKDVWPIYPWCSWDMLQVTLNGNREGKNVYVNQDEIFDTTMLESMNTVRKMYQLGYLEADIISANWDQFKLDISQGNVAMFYAETWFPAQVVEGGARQEDVGMFPYPGAKAVYSAAGKAWGISKDCASVDLAKAFMKYMLEDGRYAFACNVLPADTTVENTDPFAAELLSYGVAASDCEIAEAAFSNIKNEIELDEQAFLMSYVLESDDAKALELINEWNAKWAAARPYFVK